MSEIIPATILDFNNCPHCGGERTIELYDSYGKPMNYQLMVSMNIFKSIDTTKGYIVYFRCRKCGSTFNILWDNGIPKPLPTETRPNNFVLNFCKGDE